MSTLEPVLKCDSIGTYYVETIEHENSKQTFNLKYIEDSNDKDIKLSNKPNGLPFLNDIVHLQKNNYNYTNITIVDSINAGKTRQNRGDFYGNIIKPVFQLIGLTNYQYLETENKDSIKEYGKHFLYHSKEKSIITQSSQNNNREIVIFLSGDTSISEFLNNLDIPYKDNKNVIIDHLDILPLPLGTANAWSSVMNNNASCTEIFQKFLYNKLNLQKFPLYKVSFMNNGNVIQKSIYMMIILSMGFHANLLHLTTKNEKYKKMGLERFKKASSVILDEYDLNVHLKISYKDGKGIETVIDDNFSYFALINQSNLEPLYKPSPKSDILVNNLHLLGYTTLLTKSQLIESIMKGYNPDKDEIVKYLETTRGIHYNKIKSNDILLEILKTDTSKELAYKSEICIDGYLFDSTDFHNSTTSSSNKLKISNNEYPWKDIVRVFAN